MLDTLFRRLDNGSKFSRVRFRATRVAEGSRFLVAKLYDKKFPIFLFFLIYPLIFFWPVIFFDERSVIYPSDSSVMTDVLGFVRQGQMMQSFEWGRHFWTGYPIGEPFLRLDGFTQLFPSALTGVVALVAGPFLAGKIVAVFAWALSGTLVFFFARALGASTGFALVGGLIAQWNPGMQFAATSVPWLLFFGLTTVPLILAIKGDPHARIKPLEKAALAVLGTAFVEGYLFYFSLVTYLVLLTGTHLRKGHPLNLGLPFQRRLFLLAPLAVPVLAYFSESISLGPLRGGRRLRGPTIDVLALNGLSVRDYFVPHPESPWLELLPFLPTESAGRASISGLGLAFLVVFLVLAATVSRKQTPFFLKLTALTGAILALISFQPILSFRGVDFFNPALFLSALFPGALYLDRAGLIAQTLLIAAGVSLVSLLFAKRVGKGWRGTIALCLALSALWETNPLGTRDIRAEHLAFAEAKDIINGAPIVLIPATFEGRTWLQQVYFEAPMTNGLLGGIAPGMMELNTSSRAAMVADFCELHDRGARFAVVDSRWMQELTESVTFPLEPISKIISPSYYEPNAELKLFRLPACE